MIDVAYYTALLLVFIRLLTYFITVPIFLPKGTPNTVKIAFTGIIAFMLTPGINYTAASAINTNYMLAGSIICEVVTGLTLGYITNLCFFSIKMAGQLMDIQIGLSMITMFDPSSSSNTTLLENILYWFSLVTLLIIDGHHILIKSLIESFSIVNIGSFILNQQSIMVIIKAFIEFFAIGFKIAIPIVLIVLLTDITMGLVARTVPQLNVMILGLPVKMLVGLSCVAFALPIILKMIITSFNTLPEVLKGLYKALPLFIVFASDEKTEEATPKKKSEARKKGQVAKSKEVGLSLTLMVSTLVILSLGAYVGTNFMALLNAFLGSRLNMAIDYNSLQSISVVVVMRLALIFLPIVVPIMIIGIAANFMQTGFLVSKEAIKPQLSKLNPLNGFKRMFSKRTFAELIKDILIVTVVGYVGYSFVKDNIQTILTFGALNIREIPAAFSQITISIFFKVTLIMITVAIADYVYQRYEYNKELRMTKQEIKEEYKQEEGDPQIKSKIKQKQRELATRRMMSEVPNATVVVTNPTHIAVALRYAEGKDDSPVVIAKGADHLALKIKEVAKDNEVPIIENRTLARLIYSEVEIDSEIPVEMFQAVAEILALVYRLKKRK